MLIFHDPPETEGFPNPVSGKLELHNTYLVRAPRIIQRRYSRADRLTLPLRVKTDVSKTYIDWAIKHDFAVIDVNIPKHITGITVWTSF